MKGKRIHRGTAVQNDIAVQGTNDSSIVSKCSVAMMGYFQDAYLRHFVSKTSRRSPLINRGYFVRARAIDDILKAFLKKFGDSKNQIISLGAGFDSTYFRLQASGSLDHTAFYEVDFPQLVKRKAALIRKKTELSDLLLNPVYHDEAHEDSFGVCISSEKYHLVGVDLKQLDALQSVFKDIGVDLVVPTLLLSECVITYIDTDSSDALINWAAKTFPNGQFVSYEQVLPDDAFGIVMQKHFKKLNSPLNAIQKYSSKQKHCARFIEQGWLSSGAVNMHEYYTQVISEVERRRVEGIELFDEFEELHLICVHYILVAAFNGRCAEFKASLFPVPATCISIPDLPLTPSKSEDNPGSDLVPSPAVKPLPLQSTAGSATWMRLFSHASVLVPNTNSVLITGGFGDSEGCHGRMEKVQMVNLDLGNIVELDAAEGSDKLGPRLHHSMTVLSSGRFFIFGGRTSPAKPCMSSHILTLLDSNHRPSSYRLHSACMHEGDDVLSPRWRHTATAVTVEDREAILVSGGRGVEGRPLGDSWLLDVEKMSWQKITVMWLVLVKQLNFEGPVMEARHSHSATPWGDTSIVIAGGIGGDTTPLNSIAILNMQSKSSTLIETIPPFKPRYSHTAHIVEDQLLLLGGIQPASDTPPSLTLIHLATCALQEINLKASSPEIPLMLHNHTSHWLPDKEGVLVIGGGGNCFSFGTHLNETPVVVEGALQNVSR
ncbi:tRNA wybutosine-synthesizing protein 4 [Strongylocentrotus purpuratus]|uniref:tRNA wybutosine-synthesizing protein 4 n=1 Tax=Strongylocentrotus purpuratus TaxID=7668 RepID=A0A7M7P730_STRPU|nr:tRNA wybutosine-synthesizing protein 4 [Strongylocentrotus purpuratus]